MILIEYLYKTFLRNKVNNSMILNQYNNSKIIGDNILDGCYFVLLEDYSCTNKTYILLVENCLSTKNVLLTYDKNTTKYNIFPKNILKESLSEKAYSSLIKNGLFSNINSGFSQYNNYTSIHRLNMCLYKNILNLEVHHMDKNKKNNFIFNLVPIAEKEHKKLDILQGKEYWNSTNQYFLEFLKYLNKKRRNTIANRNEIIYEILILLKSGKTPIEISDYFGKKIGKSKIYEIKKYYFYLNDFINYVKECKNTAFYQLNGKLGLQWKSLLDFEALYLPCKYENNCFLEDLNILFDYYSPK